MVFTFENLGIIKRGRLELGDFTILCGQNNTGKTYATYSYFGMMGEVNNFEYRLVTEQMVAELDTELGMVIDLKKLVLDEWPQILRSIALPFKAKLPDILATTSQKIANFSCSIDIPPPDIWNLDFADIIPPQHHSDSFVAHKAKGDPLLRIQRLGNPQVPARVMRKVVNDFVRKLVFSTLTPPVFSISSERTGAATFRNELNFSRTRLVEALASLKNQKQLTLEAVLPALYADYDPLYPRHIRDDVIFVNRIEDEASIVSPLLSEAPDIVRFFDSIAGGEIKIARDGVRFSPQNSRTARLKLTESSSSVRNLTQLSLYLRHRAKRGDVLVIDEPELSLHASNQRQLAQLFARLVNYGIKVFITTHSDFIAKELNMLMQVGAIGKDSAPKFGYIPEEVLVANQVKAFVARCVEAKKHPNSRKLSRVNVVEAVDQRDGIDFEFPSFDRAIDDINARQDIILDALEDHLRNAKG